MSKEQYIPPIENATEPALNNYACGETLFNHFEQGLRMQNINLDGNAIDFMKILFDTLHKANPETAFDDIKKAIIEFAKFKTQT